MCSYHRQVGTRRRKNAREPPKTRISSEGKHADRQQWWRELFPYLRDFSVVAFFGVFYSKRKQTRRDRFFSPGFGMSFSLRTMLFVSHVETSFSNRRYAHNFRSISCETWRIIPKVTALLRGAGEMTSRCFRTKIQWSRWSAAKLAR